MWQAQDEMVPVACHHEIIANVLTVVLDTYPPEGGVCTYITPRAGGFSRQNEDKSLDT